MTFWLTEVPWKTKFQWTLEIIRQIHSAGGRGTIKFNSPNIKLWWHLSNRDNSTPELQITFG